MPITLATKMKHMECKIEEQADKLNKCNSFIRSLKSMSKKGEDISYLLENHNAKYLQLRYNKYDLIFNEFNNYYGVLENTDENIDINYANQQLINRVEIIFEMVDEDVEKYDEKQKQININKDKSKLKKLIIELLEKTDDITISWILHHNSYLEKCLNRELQTYIENQDFNKIDKCNEAIKLLSNLTKK